MKKDLNTKDYSYFLPPERIARYPVSRRGQSKLLVYDHGNIHHELFSNIGDFIPPQSSLYFNNTKVIPARILFTKDSGAAIEIFLLNPLAPSALLAEVIQTQSTCTWKCTIGNLKRWRDAKIIKKKHNDFFLEAELLDRQEGVVKFTWHTQQTFAEIINLVGETPLPPYLKRDADNVDKERYQTIYSRQEGAVAAPTAGLHFTPELLDALKGKNIQINFLTLHVSAGTFQPIKTEDATQHVMHSEQIIVTRENILHLLQKNTLVIPVGTTSMRTLESLYWYGCKLVKDKDAIFRITQHDPYESPLQVSKEEALGAVLDHMTRNQLENIVGETAIYIVPGYEFKICQGLITNFHQPASTLMLLVAAFIGDKWRDIYSEALRTNYHFLSYGDSSLLLP